MAYFVLMCRQETIYSLAQSNCNDTGPHTCTMVTHYQCQHHQHMPLCMHWPVDDQFNQIHELNWT